MYLSKNHRIYEEARELKRCMVATERIKGGNHNDATKIEKIRGAKMAEIKQEFEELQVLELVEKIDNPRNMKPLGSHLFTIKKFTATGDHDKFKSQLVSHRNEQDTLLYLDRSSLTAAVHMIMITLTIAACNRNYVVGKLDVKGALIQTEMKGTPAAQRFDTSSYPEYARFVEKDGVLYCRLKKALNRCMQASKLWYEKLKSFLQKEGYTCCEVDPCLFLKVVGEKTYHSLRG
jgi:hypothetical protein